MAALLVLAGRLLLAGVFGSTVPYLDQWKVTGVDVLEPWARGELTYATFFNPINDHWNVVARLYSFGLILLHGRWDNLVEITGNAFVCAAATYFLVLGLARNLERRLALALATATGVVFALPFTWENTLMGVQIDLFLQLVATVLFFRSVAYAQRPEVSWWVGLAALGLSFYTQRSAVLALPAAAVVLAWRYLQGGDRRMPALSLLACGALGGLYAATTPALADTIAMGASSMELFVDVFLRQLAWPLPHPAWALLFYLPGAWLAIDRLGRRRGGPAESMLFMVGVWAVTQAAAIALARGDVTTGFVSRYCDLLAFGFVANAFSLALLWQTYRPSPARRVVAVVAIAWGLAGAIGLWRETTAGHAGYNLATRHARNAANAEAIGNYLATGDVAHLSLERIGEHLYSYPPELQRLLDTPRIRGVLPLDAPGRLSPLVRIVLAIGPTVALAGAVGFGWLLLRLQAPGHAPAAPRPARWRGRIVAFSCWASSAIPVAVLFAWNAPFTLDPAERWSLALRLPAELGEELPLTLAPEVGRPVSPEELRGAVALRSIAAQPGCYGTLLAEGAAYTGILRSQSFVVTRDFLLVPVTGWPCWPGNAVRWRLQDPQSGESHWLPMVGDPWGPRDEFVPWQANVAAFRGWRATLYLFDGNQERGPWVGVLPPVATDAPDLTSRWQARVTAERAEATHRLVLVLAALAPLLWIVAGFAAIRGPTLPTAPPGVLVPSHSLEPAPAQH